MNLAVLRLVAGLGALLLALGAPPAQAHKASDAYLRLQVDGLQVSERLDVALRDLDRDLHLDSDADGQLRWGEVRQREAELRALLAAAVVWRSPGAGCQAPAAGALAAPLRIDRHSDGAYLVVERRWRCDAPVRDLELDYRLFADTDPLHRGLVSLQHGQEAPRTAVLGPDHARQAWALGADGRGTTEPLPLLRLGVLHILEGADHLLFLLTLLLPSVLGGGAAGAPGSQAGPAPAGWSTVARRVAGLVTGFTLAHALSLTAATLGWIHAPSRWVESAVAATVVLAALNNLWPLVKEARTSLGFAFGAVHGLAFAGALGDLGLQGWALAPPLLAFNLGIELGQLGVLAVFLLLAWPLRTSAFYRQWVLRGGSAAVALVGLVWLAERALDRPGLGLSLALGG